LKEYDSMSTISPKFACGVSIAVLALCLTMSPNDSSAALQGEIKPHEVKLLPEYCPYTIPFSPTYGSQEGTRLWIQKLGKAFESMHHYCWALIALNRANRFNATSAEKRHNYSSVVADIEFVLRYADDTFPLMPEILTRRAEAFIKLDEFERAERDLLRALAIKPDYWPAYAKLAEGLGAQGRKKQAIEVLKDGIRKSRDPRMLQRMLNELEGRSR